ncbi:MAG: hypothetical protein K0R54_433 [Clostridiaceae bacterium]|jgi:hypothetical protein|nr:hypothetical protein [Clostridiaceae bacterium]
MKQKKPFLKKKMFILVMALGTIFGFSMLVSADSITPDFSPVTKNQTTEKSGKCHAHNPEKMKSNLDKVLNEGVNSKIISQDEKSKIIDYYNSKVNSQRSKTDSKDSAIKPKTSTRDKHDFFTEAAEKGIITSDKADKLRTLMHNNMSQSKLDGIKKKLDTLVSEKTITADQENKIMEALKKDYKK